MTQTIHSNALIEFLLAPVVLFFILSIQAFKEDSIQIFIDTWWIFALVIIVKLLPNVLLRNTIIINSEQTIIYRDGLLHKSIIKNNSVKSLHKLEGYKALYTRNMLIMTYEEQGKIRKQPLSLGILYSKGNQELILKKIKEFNPNAVFNFSI